MAGSGLGMPSSAKEGVFVENSILKEALRPNNLNLVSIGWQVTCSFDGGSGEGGRTGPWPGRPFDCSSDDVT